MNRLSFVQTFRVGAKTFRRTPALLVLIFIIQVTIEIIGMCLGGAPTGTGEALLFALIEGLLTTFLVQCPLYFAVHCFLNGQPFTRDAVFEAFGERAARLLCVSLLQTAAAVLFGQLLPELSERLIGKLALPNLIGRGAFWLLEALCGVLFLAAHIWITYLIMTVLTSAPREKRIAQTATARLFRFFSARLPVLLGCYLILALVQMVWMSAAVFLAGLLEMAIFEGEPSANDSPRTREPGKKRHIHLSYRTVCVQIKEALRRRGGMLLLFGGLIPLLATEFFALCGRLPEHFVHPVQIFGWVWELSLAPVLVTLPVHLLLFAALAKSALPGGELFREMKRLAFPMIVGGLAALAAVVLTAGVVVFFTLSLAQMSPLLLELIEGLLLLLLLAVVVGMAYFSVYFTRCLAYHKTGFRETLRITWNTVRTCPGERIWAELKFVALPMLLMVPIQLYLHPYLPLMADIVVQALFFVRLLAGGTILQFFEERDIKEKNCAGQSSIQRSQERGPATEETRDHLL